MLRIDLGRTEHLRSASATGAAETTERMEARAAMLKNFILKAVVRARMLNGRLD